MDVIFLVVDQFSGFSGSSGPSKSTILGCCGGTRPCALVFSGSGPPSTVKHSTSVSDRGIVVARGRPASIVTIDLGRIVFCAVKSGNESAIRMLGREKEKNQLQPLVRAQPSLSTYHQSGVAVIRSTCPW